MDTQELQEHFRDNISSDIDPKALKDFIQLAYRNGNNRYGDFSNKFQFGQADHETLHAVLNWVFDKGFEQGKLVATRQIKTKETK